MSFENVKNWLTQDTNKRIKMCVVKASVGFILGPVAVLAAAFFLAVVFWAFTKELHPDGLVWCVLGACAVQPLLFVCNRFIPHGALIERMSEAPEGYSGRIMRRWEIMLQILLWILFTGPRLFGWAAEAMRERKRLKQQDNHSCAAVLWVLTSNLRKVPYENFRQAVPWLDLEAALPDARLIPGVLEFAGPPAGLSMTGDLREAITGRKPVD